MKTKKNVRMFNAAWLKWAVIPLLTFLLAGLVTRKLVSARHGAESALFQKTVDASLKRLDSGDGAGAVNGLVRAGQMAPGDMAQQLCLVPKFIALGEPKLAAEAMERALRAAPTEQQTARAFAGLCELLLAQDDVQNAKRILNGDLMVRWPDAPETACLQGQVALKSATGKADIEAAVLPLQKCLVLAPGYLPAQTQLGIAYARLGEWEKAEPLLRSVLEKQAFGAVALDQLGEVLRQEGKTEEATKYLDEYKRINALQKRRKQLEGQYALKKYQPADLLELGRVYEQLGEFSRAASTLHVYAHLKPADAEGQSELARVGLKLDGHQSARVATGVADVR